MGVAFYGVSEHFDYDVSANKNLIVPGFSWIDADAYFHTARHLQEDYQGVMNVFIGAEFGYTTSKTAQEKYLRVVERFSPDFIVNSIHTMKEQDYYFGVPYRDQKGNVREKREVYKEYLALVEESLQAPYPYDIVAHLGFFAHGIATFGYRRVGAARRGGIHGHARRFHRRARSVL